MLTTVLRKSGGSVTITIPRSVVALLGLAAGDVMVVEIAGAALLLKRPRLIRKRPDSGGTHAGVNGQ